MVLEEENCIDKINALESEDWHPLLELIPEIESNSKFGKLITPPNKENEIPQFPYLSESPIVSKFREVAYAIPIVIDFNWSAWDEGRKMVSDEKIEFDNVDVTTKCKLITAIIRNDRFCEGALISAFESGLILKLLKSIAKQVQ